MHWQLAYDLVLRAGCSFNSLLEMLSAAAMWSGVSPAGFGFNSLLEMLRDTASTSCYMPTAFQFSIGDAVRQFDHCPDFHSRPFQFSIGDAFLRAAPGNCFAFYKCFNSLLEMPFCPRGCHDYYDDWFQFSIGDAAAYVAGDARDGSFGFNSLLEMRSWAAGWQKRVAP